VHVELGAEPLKPVGNNWFGEDISDLLFAGDEQNL
jgi:hypothetical protein